MFSKILVAVGSPDDAAELVPVVTGLAKAFGSKVLVVHMRERVVTAAATVQKETIPEAFRFGEHIAASLVEAGVDASADIRGHRPNQLATFIRAGAQKVRAALIIGRAHPGPRMHHRILAAVRQHLA